MKRKIIFLSCLMVLSSSLCWAETVYLTNGKKITGKIVQQDDQQIKIDVSGVMVTYFSDEIDRVEGATPTAAPVASAAPEAKAPESSAPAATPTAASSTGPTQAVDASKKDLILTLIDVSGTRESMDSMFTQIISEAPPEQSGKLKEVFNLDEIISRFVPVYDKYFSSDDLTQLINFYKSSVGKKLIKVTPLLMEDSMAVSMEYFKEKMPEPPAAAQGAPAASDAAPAQPMTP